MAEEPLKMKNKDQISFDEQEARRLQAEIDKQDRLAEEEAQKALESNNAVIEQWHDVQDRIEANYKLAQRRKFFAAKRAKEKRNKPPTKSQQRSLMCTYLKNIYGWKPRALKNKSFVEVQELFDIAMIRINNFVDFRIELVEESTKKAQAETAQESSSKRAGDELDQERSKKQKVEDDKESEELKQCLEIILDDGDDVTIDATPLSLQVDEECEMAYELLRLVKKQLQE
nr:hypothetical protein [Tanacetum cinerariifolium]